MVLEYSLESDVPDYKIEPVSDEIFSFSFELLGLNFGFGQFFELRAGDGPSLRSVLFQILSNVVVVQVFIYRF